MTIPGVTSAIVQRLLPAPPDEVYAAWLDPESLLDWMCPHPARCLNVESDPRIGGRLRIDIEEDGKQFYVHGVYTDLDPPSRLGFTWSCSTWPDPTLQTQVLVTLEPRGADRTFMTITHSALSPDIVDRHRDGWQLIADQLANALL